MARVANDKKTLTKGTLNYVSKQINTTNQHLVENDEGIQRLRDEPDVKFDTVTTDDYQKQLENLADTSSSEAVQMYLWYLNDQSIATPTAYTDAEVDAIDPNIRTSDDGT